MSNLICCFLSTQFYHSQLVTLGYVLAGGLFNFSYLPYIFVSCLAGSMLTLGVSMVAISVTGTLISNVAVTSLILFLPGFLNIIYGYALHSSLKIVPPTGFGILGNPNHNIPLKFLLIYTAYNDLVNQKGLYTFLGG